MPTLCFHRFDLIPYVYVKGRLVYLGMTLSYQFQKYATVGSLVVPIVRQRSLKINTFELSQQDVMLRQSDSISKYISWIIKSMLLLKPNISKVVKKGFIMSEENFHRFSFCQTLGLRTFSIRSHAVTDGQSINC
jgi:hypothetical protein